MISKLIESFAVEIQKEENQEFIENIVNPYLSKYKYYLCLITFIMFIILCSSIYNTIVLHKLNRINYQSIKLS
jgi:hypothetical protein